MPYAASKIQLQLVHLNTICWKLSHFATVWKTIHPGLSGKWFGSSETVKEPLRFASSKKLMEHQSLTGAKKNEDCQWTDQLADHSDDVYMGKVFYCLT